MKAAGLIPAAFTATAPSQVSSEGPSHAETLVFGSAIVDQGTGVLLSTMEKTHEGHVARVRPSGPSLPRRVIARVSVNRRIDASAADTSARRGVARVEPVAGAEPVGPATEMLQPPDVTAAIFVDGSGRRSRRLRILAYALVASALMLTLALWILQLLEVFGTPT